MAWQKKAQHSGRADNPTRGHAQGGKAQGFLTRVYCNTNASAMACLIWLFKSWNSAPASKLTVYDISNTLPQFDPMPRGVPGLVRDR